MDWGRVIHVFFSLVSLTTIAGFLYEPNIVVLFGALALNLISITLKIGICKRFASELLASSLATVLHLIPAFVFLQILNNLTLSYMFMIGALISNAFCVVFLLIESVVTSETD
ncbi:DUF6394 family protein [Helicobacter cetorum]|uniref:Integral membrane protein n=1 Tax=Helicobacter cetorum (strain ATCC BAA-540 / CCUG 52418 / MIT 99-5656) TaxID=1163745 RepID=I0ES70_HELCM|nr:DUF6394 family protein [Helicobacter cetorum]AFI05789.1 hypothetical protein HCD_03865 [Helicobacter cetorum MIT 99-5656]